LQKKKIPPYKDEAYMTRVYGKAIYQSHRTTVKDPYLHFKNPVSPGPRATPRPVSALADVKGQLRHGLNLYTNRIGNSCTTSMAMH
jgi:hypothetical protein